MARTACRGCMRGPAGYPADPVLCGAAATILPARSLGQEALSRCRSFEEPQNYYLLLVHHPGRNLPAFVKDLVRLLNDTFETYFSNHDQ